jgi:membrane protein DedA with SNARE-associated domain
MNLFLDLLRNNGPLVLMAVAFFETLGVPLPAFPFIVLTGCLIVEGPISWPTALFAAIVGTISGDLIWFWLGRRLGKKALSFLCRLSINPDACVGRSEKLFTKRSTVTILTAKFVPGLNTLIPSLAGIMGMSAWRYAALDSAGSLLWASAGLSLGAAFGSKVLSRLESVRYALLLLLILMIGFYILFRIGYRIYLAKYHPVPRMQADELRQRLSSDTPPLLVDLRNPSAYSESLLTLPGAIRIPPDDIDPYIRKLPKGKEVIFFCT